ncbi:glycosyltransferase [Paenibacillus sp. YYML68]|uniref:glycosyltransferase n=1 Tax=Paenibacillus sp. YYML68 TaxID=2909250 RepID=UPI00248F9440|nr:glycosyltransferase [Paenibacillus sp. YYML68]
MDFEKLTLEHNKLVVENAQLKHKLQNADHIINQLKQELNTIYKSNGWSFLSKYYKFRDRLRVRGYLNNNKNESLITLKSKDMDMVSIVIPVYNNSEYLAKCFESAILQTYENLEVIAVDDCSTDPLVTEILQDFHSRHNNFKYIKNEVNVGISQTMNNAIIQAQGNWIAFLDCDDWLEIDAIELLMNKIKEKESNVYGYSDRYNEFKNKNSTIETFISRPTSNYFEELLKGMYTSHLKIINKRVFTKIGLHESRFDGAQDYDIALKTAFHYGDAFAYLPKPIYHHRIHEKQTTIESHANIEVIVRQIKKEAIMRENIRKGNFNAKISFVILSFEKKDMTLKCVEAIKKTVNVEHEIIIFDNGSSKETVQFLKENFGSLPSVKIYYSKLNLGCPGGRREATKLATGDYIINLDNDILVTEGWIEELIVAAEKDPNIGAVCCKTIFPDGKIQFNGGSYIESDGFITFYLIDDNKNEQDVSSALWHKCDWVPGGATLFKKVIVSELDYSDKYINAFEDNDIALQIKKMGFSLSNCPSSIVYHYHIMQNQDQVKREKKYMVARYNNDGFVQSLLNFYIRNDLIINDSFVHRLMNLEGKSQKEIKMKIEELVKYKGV